MKRFRSLLFSDVSAWLFAILTATVTVAVAVWWGALNQDEGWYLYAAESVRDGLVPYRDFFFTQGPVMPAIYSALTWVWSVSSPLHGLLGGRLVTAVFGVASIFAAMMLVKTLVPREGCRAAMIAVFSALACNLYHVYFNVIPKTYALGGLFVILGFLLVNRRFAFVGAISFALASGTRISLVLIIGVVGLSLLIKSFRDHSYIRDVIFFGLGGMFGLFIVYGVYALDQSSLNGLLAAQAYHASRGGFDFFFVVGSISRWTRGYAALAVFAAMALFLKKSNINEKSIRKCDDNSFFMLVTMMFSFLAVFLLQLSAPYPYDDYQVPLMGLLTVTIVAWLVRRYPSLPCFLPVAVAAIVSFSSPLLQTWATSGQDRFWCNRKDMTELAKLRQVASEIEAADPGGKELLTQDLYLAVECGRKVPRSLEMGPFSYFPELSTEDAQSRHVFNRELMEKLLRSAPCTIAACSGYTFAISAPTTKPVDFDEQKHLWSLLKENYELVGYETEFGQNSTSLMILRRKEASIK